MNTFNQTDVELIMQLVARPFIYPDMWDGVNRLRNKLDALLDESEDYDLEDIEVEELDCYDLGELDLDTLEADDW